MLPQQAIMVKENRIDTHAHVFAASCAIAPAARYRPAGETPAEAWLALQDAAGVTHGVLVQPSFLGTDNSYLLETLRAQRRAVEHASRAVPLLMFIAVAQEA
jgi:predicted TIM-barrel fold metal-dependent hydrolase